MPDFFSVVSRSKAIFNLARLVGGLVRDPPSWGSVLEARGAQQRSVPPESFLQGVGSTDLGLNMCNAKRRIASR